MELALAPSRRDTDRTVYVLDGIKTADWHIETGREGGGRARVVGMPEQVADCAESATGRLLQAWLQVQAPACCASARLAPER